jgi:hypothetical protein
MLIDDRYRPGFVGREALIVNFLLMTLFAVQHSLMARKQFVVFASAKAYPTA